MAWQRAVLPHFEARVLAQRTYIAQHAVHGNLLITRHAKSAQQARIDFDLELTPHDGANRVYANCHATVVNDDGDVNRPLQIGLRRDVRMEPEVAGASAIGYGDIDLGHMQGMRIIYLAHRAMAQAGMELGVALFVVVTIVNDNLGALCRHCGMRDAFRPSSVQGACATVERLSGEMARRRGWV